MQKSPNKPPPSLEMRIAVFRHLISLKVFVGDPSPRNIRARVARIVKGELAKLKEMYALSTVKGYLTFYRKELEHAGLDMHADLLRLSDDDYTRLKVDYLQQINEDQTHLRPLIPEKVITIAEDLLEADRYILRTAGLMLLTGRRVIEVLKTGRFQRARYRTDALIFSGQAKTREAEGTRTSAYTIPVLTEANSILEAHQRIRDEKGKDFDAKPNNKVTTGVSKMLTEVVREAFGHDFKPKDLRSAYAQICYHQFCPPQKSDTVYFSEILGHKLLGDETSDLMTAQSYRDFYIASKAFEAGDLAVHTRNGHLYCIVDCSGDMLTAQRAANNGKPDGRSTPIVEHRSLFTAV